MPLAGLAAQIALPHLFANGETADAIEVDYVEAFSGIPRMSAIPINIERTAAVSA